MENKESLPENIRLEIATKLIRNHNAIAIEWGSYESEAKEIEKLVSHLGFYTNVTKDGFDDFELELPKAKEGAK